MGAIGAHVTKGHRQQAAHVEREQLRDVLVREITGYFNWCPLCGGPMVPHDDEACEAKLTSWKPTGFLNVTSEVNWS